MMDRDYAREILDRLNAHGDFCALPAATVESLLYLAKELKYRAPKARNGSRGRYFHAYLTRRANGGKDE